MPCRTCRGGLLTVGGSIKKLWGGGCSADQSPYVFRTRPEVLPVGRLSSSRCTSDPPDLHRCGRDGSRRVQYASPVVDDVMMSPWAKSPGGMPGWWPAGRSLRAADGPSARRETM